MALGRKQQDAGEVYYGSGGPNEYGRTPAAPEGERYVRDPNIARANAIRASVQAYKDSRLPVPEYLAAQLAALGDEVGEDTVLVGIDTTLPPPEAGPVGTEPAHEPAAAAPADPTPPPGPVSAHAQAQIEGVEGATGTPIDLPVDDLAEAQTTTPEPVAEAIAEAVAETTPAPVVEAQPEPVVEAPKPVTDPQPESAQDTVIEPTEPVVEEEPKTKEAAAPAAAPVSASRRAAAKRAAKAPVRKQS